MNLNFNSVEISPITGNQCVYTEPDDQHGYIKLCYESGYQFMQGYIEGSAKCNEFEEVCPQILKTTRFVDPNNQVWYKLIAMSPTAILYPEGNGWLVTTIHQTNEAEVNNDSIKLDLGDTGIVLDHVHALHFDETQFEVALAAFYKLISVGNEN